VGCKALASSLALAQIARLRDYFTSHLKWRRTIEPCVLAALYTTGCMVLPLFFPCTPTTCVVDEVGEQLCFRVCKLQVAGSVSRSACGLVS
jgi:chloride channel 7